MPVLALVTRIIYHGYRYILRKLETYFKKSAKCRLAIVQAMFLFDLIKHWIMTTSSCSKSKKLLINSIKDYRGHTILLNRKREKKQKNE